MTINLENMVNSILCVVDERKVIQIYLFIGQTNNDEGIVTATYSEPIAGLAHVQLESPQNLQFVKGLNLTEIYKRFYIAVSSVTGLNRNIGTGGDYIVCENLRYNIIQVKEQFNNDFVTVIAAEQAIV